MIRPIADWTDKDDGVEIGQGSYVQGNLTMLPDGQLVDRDDDQVEMRRFPSFGGQLREAPGEDRSRGGRWSRVAGTAADAGPNGNDVAHRIDLSERTRERTRADHRPKAYGQSPRFLRAWTQKRPTAISDVTSHSAWPCQSESGRHQGAPSSAEANQTITPDTKIAIPPGTRPPNGCGRFG